MFLERRRRAEGGIESDVILLFTGGPRLDITPMFALGPGERTSPRVFTGEFIERRVPC